MKYLGVIIFVSVALSSCFSVKPTSQKSSKKLVETFYVGIEGTQYFIKPLTYQVEDSKEELEIDCIFRYKTKLSDSDSASINFSTYTNEPLKSFNTVAFEKVVKTFDQVDLMFVEKDNEYFKSRFTTKVSLIELKTFFESKSKEIKVDSDKVSIQFIPKKSTKKNMNVIRRDVLELVD
ncbi:MAG: hypothetical protein ACPG19_13615 [Saprospiraceae bacterium]